MIATARRGVNQVLLQPSFASSDAGPLSQTRARAAKALIRLARVNSCPRCALGCFAYLVKNLWLAACKTLGNLEVRIVLGSARKDQSPRHPTTPFFDAKACIGAETSAGRRRSRGDGPRDGPKGPSDTQNTSTAPSRVTFWTWPVAQPKPSKNTRSTAPSRRRRRAPLGRVCSRPSIGSGRSHWRRV